jgi:hypothetical protein
MSHEAVLESRLKGVGRAMCGAQVLVAGRSPHPRRPSSLTVRPRLAVG